MSELLIDSLDSLLSFFSRNFSEEADSFLPGLPREQIRAMFAHVDLPCPDEIVDLYNWRNGTDLRLNRFTGFPPEFCFMPLQEVMDLYENFYRKNNSLQCLNTIGNNCYGELENALIDVGINENNRLLHFIDAHEEYYSVVLTAESSYIIAYMEEGGIQDLCFQSLTSMFQTISASYQEGAYIIREGEEIELEPELFKSIWERYNPLLAQGSSSAVVDEYIEAQVEAQNEDGELWS